MKIIDKREMKKKQNKKQKTKNKKKTEKDKGAEAIVEGWELNDFVVHLS